MPLSRKVQAWGSFIAVSTLSLSVWAFRWVSDSIDRAVKQIGGGQ